MQQQKVEGQKCPDCNNALIVKNPKTGKLFCAERCWLNKGQNTDQQQAQQHDTKVSAEVWEKKDRLSAAQTAINAASVSHKNAGNDELVIEAAVKYYNWMRQAKEGFVGRGETEVVAEDENGEPIPF